MRLPKEFQVAACLAFCVSLVGEAAAQKPLWTIDLRPFGYPWGARDQTAVTFSGPDLIVYSDDESDHPLAFDKDTHRIVPEDQLDRAILPLRRDPTITKFRKAAPEINVIARWKQMTIEQIGGIGPGKKGWARYYLRKPDAQRVLLVEGDCMSDPAFAGDNEILIRPCHGRSIVVNREGHQLYRLPLQGDSYVSPDESGNRFVVYQREESFMSELAGAANRIRVLVFRSADGKKLFEEHWALHPQEGLKDGRVALSVDGSLLAVARNGEIQIFSIADRTK